DLVRERAEPLVRACDPLAHPDRLAVLRQRKRRPLAPFVGVGGERSRHAESEGDHSQQEHDPRAHPYGVYTGSENPPSTTSTWPRTIAASGEQRNATAPATSSGVTSRPAGFAAPTRSISSRFGKCSSAPVSTTPAETALTRMSGASSTARKRTSASSAAFEVPISA